MMRGLRMISINVKKKERNNNRINDMGLMKIKKKIKRIKNYIKFENKIQFY
jgi:hypothetical protein